MFLQDHEQSERAGTAPLKHRRLLNAERGTKETKETVEGTAPYPTFSGAAQSWRKNRRDSRGPFEDEVPTA